MHRRNSIWEVTTLADEQDVVSEILFDFNIGTILSYQALQGGMFLTPILVTTDTGKYVLRGHTFRTTESAMQFQAEVLEHLASIGFRCPRAVRDRLGGLGRVRDSVFWALQEYVEGQQYSWTIWNQAKADPVFVEAIGFQVAQIHDALSTARPAGDVRLSPSLPPVQFGAMGHIRLQWKEAMNRLWSDRTAAPDAPQCRQAFLETRGELEEHWERLEAAVRTLGINDLPRQLVHGDISPVNMIFDDGGCTFALIDWDCLHVGVRLYDALGDVLNRPPREFVAGADFNVDEVRAYLKGYQSGTRRPVTRQELDCVSAFCIARQLEDLRQRVWVLPSLAAEQDEEYAALIRGRVRMLGCIRACTTNGFTLMEQL